MKTLLLTSALSLFATATAFAQPAAAPPAPKTDDWKDVSHINGQPVKVGERGEYLYKNPKLNIATDPVSWLFGLYGVSASYALSNNIAIRGDVDVLHTSDGVNTGYEVGLSAPIYLKRTYRGPFLEPGLIVHSESNIHQCFDDGNGGCTSERTFVGPEMMVGWHYSFDSGLNAAFAVGVAKNVGKQMAPTDDGDMNIMPVGYFRVGYEL